MGFTALRRLNALLPNNGILKNNRKSLGLRGYFIVYPYSWHNTVTVLELPTVEWFLMCKIAA